MEIVLAALVAAAVAVAVVLSGRPRAVQAGAWGRRWPCRAPGPMRCSTARDGLEEELVARRTEIARQEEGCTRARARSRGSRNTPSVSVSSRTGAATSIRCARS